MPSQAIFLSDVMVVFGSRIREQTDQHNRDVHSSNGSAQLNH